MGRLVPLALLLLGCSSPPAPLAAQPSLTPTNAEEQVAVRALASGRPLAAQQALAPRLRSPAGRTPVTLLLAASAAVARGQYAMATSLIEGAPWLDTLGGLGRRVLATAYLADSPRTPRGDSLAARHAAHGVTLARGPERGARLVLLARALERRRHDDSAAQMYRAAGEALPTIAGWLRLRAAVITERDGARERLLRDAAPAVGDERFAGPAVIRARWDARRRSAEISARLRYDDTTGAIRVALTQGSAADSVDAIGWQLATRSTDPSAARARLVRYVADTNAAVAAAAIATLDRYLAPLTDAEELAIARRAASLGDTPRAQRAFTAASRETDGASTTGGMTDADRFRYGTLLQQQGRHRDAIPWFARITTGDLAGIAAYQRARSGLRLSEGSAASAQLRRITTHFAADSEAAGLAWYLLGDLAAEGRKDAQARESWATLARRYPQHRLTARGLFRGAIIALANGDRATAEREFRALAQRPSTEQAAAEYWLGRLQLARGDRAGAHRGWRALIARTPESYYAWLAAERLDTVPWRPESAASGAASSLRPDTSWSRRTAARIALLDSLGLTPEATTERSWLQLTGRTSPTAAHSAADALLRLDRASPAIRLAQSATEQGAPRDATLYRVLYPFPFEALITEQATARTLNPALVAALIRQESRFTPAARSSANARGMMQVMPPVGRAIAAGLDVGPWSEQLLDDPETNVLIGMRHLATVLQQAPGNHPAYALAAYNAGPSRLRRWRTLPGSDDWELFVERIPFEETRDYVRIVLRNREWYRALYDLTTSSTPRSLPRSPS